VRSSSLCSSSSRRHVSAHEVLIITTPLLIVSFATSLVALTQADMSRQSVRADCLWNWCLSGL